MVREKKSWMNSPSMYHTFTIVILDYFVVLKRTKKCPTCAPVPKNVAKNVTFRSLVNVVVVLVVARESQQNAETWPQREEDLRGGVDPDLPRPKE